MNQRTDKESLLADVLAEESRGEFSAALLGETLRHARRRRRWRQMRRVSGALALLVIAGFGFWQVATRPIGQEETARLQKPPPAFHLVISEPLAIGQVVTTRSLPLEQQSVAPSKTAVVHTRDGEFREVGDDELLALASPQIVALVRRGPHAAELVFVLPPETSPTQQN